MVFPESNEVDAELIGQRCLGDDVAQDLRLRQGLTVLAGHVTERVEPQFDLRLHA
jgi:hypothetical protein